MEQKDIRNTVLAQLAVQGTKYVPVGVSARHVHLCQKDLDALFGPGHPLQPFKQLSQPGQFAAQERVTIVGPKGEIGKVRVLGPVRKRTQVEVTFSDLMRLGLPGQVRMSGDVDGTPGCTLVGPAGRIEIPCGVMVAARHLHLSTAQAGQYGLKNGDAVALRMDGPRPGVLENVICRVGEGHDLEAHLDTDEANAFGISNGTLLEIVGGRSGGSCAQSGGCSCGGCHHDAPAEAAPAVQLEPSPLVTERDVVDAYHAGAKVIPCTARCIVTDAALERAEKLHIAFQRCKE